MKYLCLLIAMLLAAATAMAKAPPEAATDQAEVFSHPLKADNREAFHEVEARLTRQADLKGKFTLTRHIKLLSNPLHSSGNFRLSHRNGLYWQQQDPFEATLTLNQNKLTQQLKDQPRTVITRDKQPMIFTFTHIFLSVLQGHRDTIKQNFKRYFTGSPEHWQIGLRPRHAPLNKAIASIILKGDHYLRTVVLRETRGNSMVIHFHDIESL